MKKRIASSVETPLISMFIYVFLFLSAFAVAQDSQERIKPLDSEKVDSQNGVDAELRDSETVESENGEVVEFHDSEDFESQIYELNTTLYCFCGCDRMTYEICHCVTAEYMKKEFRNALKEGQTVAEIRATYLEEHGPQYSAVMHAEGINLLAYIMPAMILVIIGGVAVVVLQNSRRNKAQLTQPDNNISEEMQRQLEAELERYKDQN